MGRRRRGRRRRRRRTTVIKSNNPHLAGGEKMAVLVATIAVQWCHSKAPKKKTCEAKKPRSQHHFRSLISMHSILDIESPISVLVGEQLGFEILWFRGGGRHEFCCWHCVLLVFAVAGWCFSWHYFSFVLVACAMLAEYWMLNQGESLEKVDTTYIGAEIYIYIPSGDLTVGHGKIHHF